MIPVSVRLALRNVGRHPRRSLLSVLGLGIGCSMAIVSSALIRGRDTLFEKAAAENGGGDLRVVPMNWLERREPSLRLESGGELLVVLRRMPMIDAASPRVKAAGLLAMGSRVVSVELSGVEPDAERRLNRLIRAPSIGRYLATDEPDSIVLGAALADRLRVSLGDELVVTVVGRGGEMASALLRIVGIAATGSRDIDASIAHVPLATLSSLTGRPGIGEIAILLSDRRKLDLARTTLESHAGTDEVLSWRETHPELAAHLKLDGAFSRILDGILVCLVLLGVAGAQLTEVFERRREFAVLAALGTSPWRLGTGILAEGLVLGALGSAAALLISWPIVGWLATEGIDLARWFRRGEGVVEGLLLEPRMTAELGAWMIPEAFGLAMAAAVIASLYPAWSAARTEPALALRVAA